MTLTDLITTEMGNQKEMTNIGGTIRDLLSQAKAEGRVTCGLFECAKLLQSDEDNILLCLLPNESSSADVTVHIQHTLIEAFCWENEIRLLKVDSSHKLGSLLTDTSDIQNDNDLIAGRGSNDYSCVLITERDSGEFVKSEKCLTDFYNNLMSSDIFPCPVITLPV